MKNREAGYTLLELVVALCIIGILSAIAIMQYQHIKAKAHAAQVSSNLHAVEDGIISAIIDGRTAQDFSSKGIITSANFGSSILASYLTEANFNQLPAGISFRLATSGVTPNDPNPEKFSVVFWIEGEAGTERILDELEKMFPKYITHFGRKEFVVVESSTLKVRTKS
jgi:prepilin-type N-terminal cleavage/methylation domain-containing protein